MIHPVNAGFDGKVISECGILHLVGGILTPLKNLTSSVGMMKFPMYGKIKNMFQTTNQSLPCLITGGYAFRFQQP